MKDPTEPGIAAEVFESICTNVSVALYVLDVHQHCMFMNPAAVELTGYTLREVEGKPLQEVIHPKRPEGKPDPNI